jgi:hypothetical protein
LDLVVQGSDLLAEVLEDLADVFREYRRGPEKLAFHGEGPSRCP